jgi:hypothetical protein
MKHKKPKEPAYVKHRLEMLCSPAWRALSPAAKCVLERLEIEHMRHAGKNNGQLICTYQDFVDHGIRRMSIAPAIRQLTELGFVVITQRGWRSSGHHRPAHYRLTYVENNGGPPPTDEWSKVPPPTKHEKCASRGAKTIPAAGSENDTRAGIENATRSGNGTPKNRERKRYSYLDASILGLGQAAVVLCSCPTPIPQKENPNERARHDPTVHSPRSPSPTCATPQQVVRAQPWSRDRGRFAPFARTTTPWLDTLLPYSFRDKTSMFRAHPLVRSAEAVAENETGYRQDSAGCAQGVLCLPWTASYDHRHSQACVSACEPALSSVALLERASGRCEVCRGRPARSDSPGPAMGTKT